jgi:hypothetical protein
MTMVLRDSQSSWEGVLFDFFLPFFEDQQRRHHYKRGFRRYQGTMAYLLYAFLDYELFGAVLRSRDEGNGTESLSKTHVVSQNATSWLTGAITTLRCGH